MQEKRELILTAIGEFWPSHPEHHFFLGPWCFAGNPKISFYDQHKYRVFRAPWTESTMLEHYQKQRILCDKLLTAFLTELPSEESDVYWRTLLSPWLLHWIGTCYDKYYRLVEADAQLDETLTVNVVQSNGPATTDYCQFWSDISCHHYNLLLMSDILMSREWNHLKVVRHERFFFKDGKRNHLPLKNKLKQRVSEIVGSNSYFILGPMTGLSISQRMSLLKFFGKSGFFKAPKFKRSRKNLVEVRQSSLASFSSEDHFEKFTASFFFKYVPQNFLFSYTKFLGRQRYWVGPDFTNDIDKIAAFRAAGGSVLSYQHGGGYGLYEVFPWFDLERDLSDHFYLWSKLGDGKFSRDLPSPKLSKQTRTPSNEIILYTSTAYPTYSYRFHSLAQPDSMLSFKKMSLGMIKGLTALFGNMFVFRPYPNDYGTNDVEFFRGEMGAKSFKIDLDSNFNDLLASASLAIFDHPMTGFMESFAINKPTMLVFDPNCFYMNKEAISDFDELCAAKVVHYSVESMLSFLRQIDGEIFAWWHKPSTQTAKKMFMDKHLQVDPLWRSVWRQELKKLALKA